ncbi:uncharacterized protein [Choristoneura fumiferana]|uniref:uncharacterized protein n=1 Tax=Choristoneura fumiferana TaxID=7141 RepID=UPI003D157746
MTAYIDNTMKIVQQLADIGKVIDDSEVAELLLSGLPQEFDPLVSNLSTACLTSTVSSEFVRARLIQEETRKLATCTSETAFISNSTKAKKKTVCNYCHKEGHIKAKCFKLKRDKKLNHGSEQSMAAAFQVQVTQNDIFVDSGCTATMFNKKECFISLKDCSDSSVAVANNDRLKCEGTGVVSIQTSTNQNGEALQECVPCLEGKLASLPFPKGGGKRATKALELVHSDVAGPLASEQLGWCKLCCHLHG